MENLINLPLINGTVKGICKKTNSFDYFEDMKSELILAVLENKIVLDVEGLTKYAWSLYRKWTTNKRIFLDIDIYHPAFNPNKFSVVNYKNTKYYDIKLVKPVYQLYTSGIIYKEIGKILKISQTWAKYQILNTLHLPIVSTKLKNKAIDVNSKNIENLRKKNNFKYGSKNISAKLNEQKVLEIRHKHNEKISVRKLAKEYSVSVTTVRYVINKVTWKHVA